MTGRFDTYIYTNCRADEGLQHRDGFQFQAVSPGADRSAMAIVQRSLLYEASPQWMRERRPVSDYPPSLAHVSDGLYATAAGVYLGRESGGGREGNQLTHALATSDPAAYGLVRPAQMFGAPFWTTVPAPTKECPALEGGWQPGPFGVPEAQRFVQAQERGADLLAALLSELRRTDRDRRRVLFVAREPESVLRWVIAATVLIPQREALEIDFKIFTLNPAYADHRILAVHPDWSTGAASLDNQLGYAVVDLVRHAWTPITPDPQSRHWVELFLEEDPYDVADAVEVAADAGLPSAAGTAFGVAVVLGRPPATRTIRALVDWLDRSSPELIHRYGPALVDQLLTTVPRWPVEELVKLDAATSRNLPSRAAPVRLHLLRAELREAGRRPAVRPPPLPVIDPEGWDEAAESVAVDLLVEALRNAPPERFELLLQLAARFRVEPPLPLLEPGLERFVAYWARHPGSYYEPERWADGDGVEDRLRALLGRRLADRPALYDELGDDWWEVLLTEPMHLRTPLDDALVSAAVAKLDAGERPAFVAQLLRDERMRPDPGAALEHAAAVLWRRSAPTPDEARLLCRLRPKDLTFGPGYFPRLSTGLTGPQVSDDDFEAAYVLIEEEAWQARGVVREAVEHERNIRYVRVQLAKKVLAPERLFEFMSRVPLPTLRSHYKRLLDAMVQAPVAAAVLAVLTAGPELGEGFAARIARIVSDSEKPWQPAHMALAYVCSHEPLPPFAVAVDEQILDTLRKSVNEFLVRSSSSRLEQVEQQIDALGEPWPANWQSTVRSVRGGRLGRMLRRGR
jgi:hypothetical protein